MSWPQFFVGALIFTFIFPKLTLLLIGYLWLF